MADDLEIKVVNFENKALVSIVPPQGTHRTPCDIVCVIDVSGSMGAEATLKTGHGESESTGLTVLDIVKHAVKTIVASMSKDDRVALVEFSDNGHVLLELTAMDDSGQAKALEVTGKMHPGGSTNIWDGLLKGLDVLTNAKTQSRNRAVLLLTDGEPVVIPPGGHLAALNNYKDSHDGLPGAVFTFGFGYRLDSPLLCELAHGGNGLYSFIPDSSFVGTIFVHTVAALLTTVATHLTLSIEPHTSTTVSALVGHNYQQTSWGAQLNFGSINYGQSKDVVVQLSKADFNSVTVTLKYKLSKSGEEKTKSITVEQNSATIDKKALLAQEFRLKAAETISSAMKDAASGSYKKAMDSIKALAKLIGESEIAKNAIIKDLLKDVEGQMVEAVSKDEYYNKWGKHYLPSLQGAHLFQQCNNFKDPGVQHYGGKLFQQLRDEADATFLKLPAPTPSKKVSSYGSSSSSRSYAPVSMSSYNSSANPCFAGESSVLLADNTSKLVRDVKSGDVVASSNGDSATVKCVVKTVSRAGKAQLVKMGSGLLVTPYHPIRVNGQWTFPCDVAPSAEMPCDAVYSFVIEQCAEKVMIINGVECVSLAHHLTDSPVVQHDYFGTDKVLTDLQRMQGWSDGLVTLQSGCLERDAVTGRVVGLKQETA